jgi:plasmid stabilization system protein ParE
MSYRLRVRLMAEADITAAALWYEARRAGLGDEFLAEVDRGIKRALDNPLTYRVIYPKRNTRRVLVSRFPCRIFFTIEVDEIVVHAVLHARRHDRVWKERLG